MNDKKFPDAKNVIKKRTKNGQRFLLHGKDLAGKDLYVTIPIKDTDTDEDYLRKVKECRIKLNEKILGGSFYAIINQYFEYKQYSQNSRKTSKFLARFCMNDKKNKQLVKEIIESKELKATTKVVYINKINAFFNWMGNVKHINIENPLNDLIIPRCTIKSRRTRCITEEETERLFKMFDNREDKEYALFVRLAYFTGARASSIHELTPDSFHDGKIYYNNVKCKKQYDYAIPLVDEETVRLYTTIARRGYMWSHPLRSLCATIDAVMNKAFGRDVRGETLSLHSLRHSFASRAIQNGIPPEIVARLLDHASISTTLTYYARHSQGQIDDAVSKIFSDKG